MRTPAIVISVFLVSGISPVRAQERISCTDAAPQLLVKRANLEIPSTGHFSSQSLAYEIRPGRRLLFGNPGVRLFYGTGSDNAPCVRSVPDINGDGRQEMIAGFGIFQSQDNLYCYDGASSQSGSVLWSLETSGGASGGYFYGDQCLSIGPDVTGDGSSEILAGLAGGGRFAAAYNGADGQLIWIYDTYLDNASGWVYSIESVGDVNGDGVQDVFFGTGSDHNAVHMIDGTSSGVATSLWQFTGPDVFYSVAGSGDLNGDSIPDVVASTGDLASEVFAFHGRTGARLWRTNVGGSTWHVNDIDDIDGDGAREIIVASWAASAQVHCLDGATGTLLWETGFGDPGMRVDPIEDVDGDGYSDILFSSWDNALHCLSSADGTPLWSASAGTQNGGDVWSASAIDDVNGDCHQDAAFGSFDGQVRTVDGISGQSLWLYDTSNRVFSIAPTEDLNGDGQYEVFAGTQDTSNSRVALAFEGDSNLEGPTTLELQGIPSLGAQVSLVLKGPIGASSIILLAFDDGCLLSGLGHLKLDPFSLLILTGFTIPGSGRVDITATLPLDPVLIGVRPHLQSAVIESENPLVGSLSNRVRFSILP